MDYFTQDNTDNYTDEQLAELNRRYRVRCGEQGVSSCEPTGKVARLLAEGVLAEYAADVSLCTTPSHRPAADRFGDLLTSLLKPLYEHAGLPWADSPKGLVVPGSGCPADLVSSLECRLLDLQAEVIGMVTDDLENRP